MPRPPIQHHKHIISLAPETVEVLEDLQSTFIKGKALRAAGEAAEGILSNPNLAFLVAGGLMAALGSYIGKDVIDDVFRYFGAVQRALAPDATDEEKKGAVSDMETTLGSIIKFFSPLGGLTPGV